MWLSVIDRVRLDKAAVDEGFGLKRADDGNWLAYEGLGTPAAIRLGIMDGRYLVATDHVGAATDLAERWPKWPVGVDPRPPAGFTAFAIDSTAALQALIHEIWRLARSLPVAPLRRFEAETRNMPRATEAERLVVQRVGQSVYRDALMTYWNGRCAITSLAVPELLRASHAKPWAACETDAERLDVFNGLLLAAHLDAAFDAGLITVGLGGEIILSGRLDAETQRILGLDSPKQIEGIKAPHEPYLAWHRQHEFR